MGSMGTEGGAACSLPLRAWNSLDQPGIARKLPLFQHRQE